MSTTEPEEDAVTKAVDQMISYLQDHGTLPHPKAAKIARSIDEGLTYGSLSSGGFLLSSELLDAFRKRTRTYVVWKRGGNYWRYRVDADPEGTRAV